MVVGQEGTSACNKLSQVSSRGRRRLGGPVDSLILLDACMRGQGVIGQAHARDFRIWEGRYSEMGQVMPPKGPSPAKGVTTPPKDPTPLSEPLKRSSNRQTVLRPPPVIVWAASCLRCVCPTDVAGEGADLLRYQFSFFLLATTMSDLSR